MITINFIPDPLIECDFENIYHPSDDSYLLLDYFRKKITDDSFDGIMFEEIEYLLDMGTGTGIIAIFFQLLNSLKPKFNPKIYGSDILEESLICARRNEILNKIKSKIVFFQSDLFKSFPESLRSKFNIIIFNPPYLPSSPLIKESLNKKGIDHSWDGGYKGIEILIKFFKELKEFINLNKTHYIYFISSSNSNLFELEKQIVDLGYRNEQLDKIHLFFEDIILNRLKFVKC
ncbi:MAG: HemK2/MTQ2 family protein methyltransferase [Candidatus Thorarchaeota archaeon]